MTDKLLRELFVKLLFVYMCLFACSGVLFCDVPFRWCTCMCLCDFAGSVGMGFVLD